MLISKLDNCDAFASALLTWPVYKWGSSAVQGAQEPSESRKVRGFWRFLQIGAMRVGFPFFVDRPKVAR